MRTRHMWLLVVCLVAACAAAGGTATASHRKLQQPLSVGGAVSAPATYAPADLSALPQTTAEVTRPTFAGPVTFTVEGVSLQSLVTLAQPVLPAGAKNGLLRVTITVDGRFGRPETLTLGELDPNFGNHPAILALKIGGFDLPFGPELVIPGDSTGARSVHLVRKITIGVQSPATAVPAHAGDVTVTNGQRTKVLSATTLAGLPAQTRTVSFFAGTSPQTHTETGPTLPAVLRAAHLGTGRDSWVAAVGSDGYVATVTPGEAKFGGRPLLFSLIEDGIAQSQPRLVVDGDVKGGRYVSGVTKLVVGNGPQLPSGP